MQPFIWFHPSVIQFQVLLLRADKLVSLKQAKMPFKSSTMFLGPDGVIFIPTDRSLLLDKRKGFLWLLGVE